MVPTVGGGRLSEAGMVFTRGWDLGTGAVGSAGAEAASTNQSDKARLGTTFLLSFRLCNRLAIERAPQTCQGFREGEALGRLLPQEGVEFMDTT